MLFGITFLTLICALNAFFIKDDAHIFQDVDANSSLSKSADFDIYGSDPCSCKNGRCVKDNRGNWKCMCFSGHSMKGKDCELCDCGKKGKCIFTETFSEQTRSVRYEKKCVCDTGYADRYGTCTECVCGVNSKCEFEYGEKNCYCMEGYAELNGVCTECNCGEGGYCEFLSGKKVCTCYEGYLFDGHICAECDCGQGNCRFVNGQKECDCEDGLADKDGMCTATCTKDENCVKDKKCGNVEGWNTCICADGLSGENCDLMEWCTDPLRFKNCKGVNGTCDYDEEKRSVVCSCAIGKEFHPAERRCKITCANSDDCKNGGKCEGNFCSCNSGVFGDICENVFDCTTDGKYKGCSISGGICTYDGSNADCKCPANTKYHDVEHKCIECDCGPKGTCRFENRQRICDCESGFAVKNGICTATCKEDKDCKKTEKCRDREGWNTCECADGLSGENCDQMDWCEDNEKFENCKGLNGTCDYDEQKRSVVCSCPDGKQFRDVEKRCRDTCVDSKDCDNGGRCVENFCVCKSGIFGDKCETVFECTKAGKYKGCVESGGICIFDGSAAQCKCPVNKKYDDKEHLCKATCGKDRDCTKNEKCRNIEGWNTCQCADGLSGEHCDQKDWCADNEKFENCKGLNGTCDYDEQKRSVVCSCPDRKQFRDAEKRCRDTCYNNEDCKNGGKCEDNICFCNVGTFGDKCEIIFDCTTEGRYKGCLHSGGTCIHDGSNSECICPANRKYHDVEHKCIECDCGAKGACRFENGHKKCDCMSGFAVKDGICTATCYKDYDCDDKQKCVEKDGWKTCVCADGLSGANCEKRDWCESTGKFKNCKGENGSCEYVKDQRLVDCICTAGKALHAIENRCRDTCDNNADCENGGICKGNFCSCNAGLLGDKCEEVSDCARHGKYKDCESSGGKCYYDGRSAICECFGNKILHNKEHICKECHCGDHGSCAFDYEEKICLCNNGYSEKNGKCEICDCGENGYCAFQGNEKVCTCDAGYSENYGKCESCDCGEGGWCTFINGEKTCECGDGYSEQNGKCEICDCGVRGWCYFAGGQKLCKCEDGYAEKNGRCEVCSCGKNTICKFIYGAKACLCLQGYTFNEVTGECEECDCGLRGSCGFLNGKKTCICEKGFSEDSGKCKVCDCGEDASNCSFVQGQKHCTCKIGFVEENGRCKRLQSCEPNPCVNGHCVARENDFLCVCDDPFTGRYCEISTCIETKCFGGRCRVIENKEECICPVGHKLANGTCAKTFCVEKKCYDGECVIQNGVEICICPEDYVSDGNECRKVKCSERSCIGGSCRIVRGNIEDCVCPIGHVLIDNTCTITTCTPRTCYGGRCEKRDDELICICPDGFHLEGVGCIETTCKEQNCFGGKCRVINGKEICTCLDGHILKNDQCQKVRCVEKHCFGGKCDVVDGEEICSCPVGFEVQGDVCREIQHH